MKRFLRKIFFYIFIPVLLSHILLVIIYLLVSIHVDRKLNEIAQDYPILIMGDSQMQKISPDFFNPKTCNLASAGENYFFTYSKLQKLVASKNHRIQCILLGVSTHNFAPLFVNSFSLSTLQGKISLKTFLFYFNVFNNEFVSPEKLLFNKDFFLGILSGPQWGGHDSFPNKNPQIPFIESRLKLIYGEEFVDDLEHSAKQEYYLDKIAELCRKENINLVMVSNPVHPYYKSHIADVYFDALHNAVSSHNNLLYLNYLNDSVPTIYLSDANHLNKEGAVIYSKKINLALKNKISLKVVPTAGN